MVNKIKNIRDNVSQFGKLWETGDFQGIDSLVINIPEISYYKDPYGNTVLHKVVYNEPNYQKNLLCDFLETPIAQKVFKPCLNQVNNEGASGLELLLNFNSEINKKIAKKEPGSGGFSLFTKKIQFNIMQQFLNDCKIKPVADNHWLTFFEGHQRSIKGSFTKIYNDLAIEFLEKVQQSNDEKFKLEAFYQLMLSDPTIKVLSFFKNNFVLHDKLNKIQIEKCLENFNEKSRIFFDKNVIDFGYKDNSGNNLLHLSGLNFSINAFKLVTFLNSQYEFNVLEKNAFGYSPKEIFQYSEQTFHNPKLNHFEIKAAHQSSIELLQALEEGQILKESNINKNKSLIKKI